MVKGNQPCLLAAVAEALAGPDADFAETAWAEEGNGHGRRERRSIRTAPAAGLAWPHAAQVLRIRRDSGPTRGPWTHKEIAYGITSLPEDLAGPATSPSMHATTGESKTGSTKQARHYDVSRPCSRDAGMGQGPAGPGGSG